MRLQYLRSAGPSDAVPRSLTSGLVGVDKNSRVIRGAVIAEAGEFKNESRGRFDRKSLSAIVTLMQAYGAIGLPSRFTHPEGDGLGWFLGRWRGTRIDGPFVRADLHFDPAAAISPHGNLSDYILMLSTSDPRSFGTSLVVETDLEYPPAEKGTSDRRPPTWRPTAVYSADLVEIPEASHHGILPDQFNSKASDDAMKLSMYLEINR